MLFVGQLRDHKLNGCGFTSAGEGEDHEVRGAIRRGGNYRLLFRCRRKCHVSAPESSPIAASVLAAKPLGYRIRALWRLINPSDVKRAILLHDADPGVVVEEDGFRAQLRAG